jgi:hypothetical protein
MGEFGCVSELGVWLMDFRTYLIFACFCFSMCVFVWFFIPETKGGFSLNLWLDGSDMLTVFRHVS